MTTITISAETIAKLEAAGFNRWTKNGMDRLYVNADTLGLEVKVSRAGKAKSEGIWNGAEVYRQEADEILHSKVWIDVITGELHVVTDSTPHYGEMTVEDAAIAYIESVIGTDEPEPTEDETEDEITETEDEETKEATVKRILDSTPGWQRTEKCPFPISFGGSHKYRVKAVTTTLFSNGSGEKKVRTYYVSSIRQLLFGLNQTNDYIQRVHSEWYNTVKGTYITAHYVERIY